MLEKNLIGEHECLVYNSKVECKTCNGRGRDTTNREEIKPCYITLNLMENYLGMNGKRITKAGQNED